MLADFQDVENWLAARCGREIAIPDGFTPYGGFADPTSMLVRQVPKGAIDLGGISVALHYEDVVSEESKRIVRLRRAWLDSENDGLLTGFCELRREPRMFRVSRIVSLIDLTTGEVVTDALGYFVELGIVAPDTRWLAAMQNIRDGIRVLTAFSLSDGRLSSDELVAIVRYADDRASDLGVIFDEKDHCVIEKVARRMHPDLECARDAIDAVSVDPQHLKLLLRSMRSLAHADDCLSYAEKIFASQLGVRSVT